MIRHLLSSFSSRRQPLCRSAPIRSPRNAGGARASDSVVEDATRPPDRTWQQCSEPSCRDDFCCGNLRKAWIPFLNEEPTAAYHKEDAMAKDPYDEIFGRAKDQLSPDQQRRLVDELAQHAARKRGQQRHSVLKLEGLGSEIWAGMDPDEYVAEERDSWNG